METQLLFTSPNPPVQLPEVTLHELIVGGARSRAQATALIDAMSGESLTYGALADRVYRVAAALVDRGVAKGDVVAVVSANCLDYPVATLGVMAAGGVVSGVNPTYTGGELVHQLNDAGATRVIVGEIRGVEVLPMMLAMSQGNDGSLSTIHADSSHMVFSRLQMYMAMTPERFDVRTTNLMVSNAIHFIIHLEQLPTQERVVTSVLEIRGVDDDMVGSNEVYSPDPTGRAVPDVSFSDVTMDRLERAERVRQDGNLWVRA